MRAIICLLVVAGSVQAGTISVPFSRSSRSDGRYSAPRDAVLQIATAPNESSIIAEWRIEDIGTTNEELVQNTPAEPRSWTVTEADSLVNWAAFEAAVINPDDIYFRYAFVGDSWSRWPSQARGADPYAVMQDLDAIEFHLPYFVGTLIGSAVSWQFAFVGEGQFIPEPASLSLALLVLTFVVGSVPREAALDEPADTEARAAGG